MRYQDGLAAELADGFPRSELDLMTLAHLAGFSELLSEWRASAGERDSPVAEDRQRLFAALLAGDVATIEAVLRTEDPRHSGGPGDARLAKKDRARPRAMHDALKAVVTPLVLLGRGDALAALHLNSLRRLGAGAKSCLTKSWVTARAALDLAEAGDWDHALEILGQARDIGAEISVSFEETRLWQYAYLHRQVERVLPRLAEMPFRQTRGDLRVDRTWDLKDWQIRAGMAVDVPVIEDPQPDGYMEAAAMQIAALDGDPEAADRVAELRRVLRPQPIDMRFDYGIPGAVYDAVQDALSRARAQTAASRKDYARAAALAALPSPGFLIDPPGQVIDALLEEGDWRAAADIAKAHDPRQRDTPENLPEAREEQFVDLYDRLAIAAAWSGDDAAAAAFVAQGKDVEMYSWRWTETLLAGATEGLLPRKLLHVFRSAFG